MPPARPQLETLNSVNRSRPDPAINFNIISCWCLRLWSGTVLLLFDSQFVSSSLVVHATRRTDHLILLISLVMCVEAYTLQNSPIFNCSSHLISCLEVQIVNNTLSQTSSNNLFLLHLHNYGPRHRKQRHWHFYHSCFGRRFRSDFLLMRVETEI